METILSDEEARVLGALIEKELTTPEYYPLTVNALTNACNQKSNREPVVTYDARTVLRTVENLRGKNLTMMVTGAGSRAAKYKHTFARRFQFNEKEVAALCVLMLRGPQTVGEIRGRSGRLYDFQDLAEVENTLNGLINRGEGAYVLQLPRQPGRKESRYAHLLCGEVEIPEESYESKYEPAPRDMAVENERIALLENEVEQLQQQITELKTEFETFKQQFE